MNLRKQVEPLSKPRFRLPRTEACTPRSVATHFDETLAQTSLPPSRAKQGTQTLAGILVVPGVRFKVDTVRGLAPDRAGVRAPRCARPAGHCAGRSRRGSGTVR